MGRWIAIAVLVILVLIAIPWARRNRRKFNAHNDDMQAWAESHGCSYVLEDNSQYEGHHFYPFGQSDSQYAHRVITGKYAEHNIAVYDFFFAAGGGGPSGSSNDVYFAMIMMELSAVVPYLHVTQRKHLKRHDLDDAISTGDEAFDSVYALFADDHEYAKSAVSATVRSGLPAQSLTGMHIVNGRLFLWQYLHKHDASLIEDRLRFAATVVAELPAPK